MQAQLYSGARCTISANGAPIAAAFVADWSIETNAQELETIDSVFPAELAPTRIRVTLGLRVYRHPGNDPVLGGLAPGSGDIGQPEQTAFLSAQYISILIQDTLNNTILTLPKAWIVRRQAGVSSGDFLTESWSVVGIGYFGPGA